MKRSSVFCSVILGVFAVSTGQTIVTESQTDAEAYIKAGEAAWAESVATNDASVVKRISADDCVWVLDGRVVDKATAVAEAAAGPGDFLWNPLDYAHVRFFWRYCRRSG